MATPDEYVPGAMITTIVDGETVQQGSTADTVFSPQYLVAYISRILTLNPGDVIITGTPSGVGHAREPRKYLSDGSVLETQIEGLGGQRNRAVPAASVPAAAGARQG
jgi:acylpyruvate hydrolase